MRDYFKGWGRKFGVVSLVCACVFTAGWIRSINRLDFVTSCWTTSSYAFQSIDGSVRFARRTPAARGPILSYGLGIALDGPIQKPYGQLDTQWRFDWLGFHFGVGENPAGTIRLIEFWIIPYWSIVVPLTLLSAYLLLSKLGKSTSQENTEPIATEGD